MSFNKPMTTSQKTASLLMLIGFSLLCLMGAIPLINFTFPQAAAPTTASTIRVATATYFVMEPPTATFIPPTPTVPAPKDIGSMLLIPAGAFQMGCDPQNNGGMDCSDPTTIQPHLQTVYLDAYQIDKYEVTNASFAQCVAAGSCYPPKNTGTQTTYFYYDNPPFANYPVTSVDWLQANAYCTWAGKRLPTEAEWEKAARGSTDTRPYPWGDAAPTCALANFGGAGGCVGDTAQVGSYPLGASPYGALDMAGNVNEWVADWWQERVFLFLSAVNPLGPADGIFKVFRGGDWNSSNLRAAYRTVPTPFGYNTYLSQYYGFFTGFRCAASEGYEPVLSDIEGRTADSTPAPVFSAVEPQPGTANLIGRVLWNDQPVIGAEVMLCEGYDIQPISIYSGGCTGSQITTTTDLQGIYLFANVTPREYVVLTHAMDVDGWFYEYPKQPEPAPGVIAYYNPQAPVKWTLTAGQTLELDDLLIYKVDLKITSPKSGELYREAPTLTWEAYPGAAYYGVSLGSDPAEKVITNTIIIGRPLQNCEYDWTVEAYNVRGIKIAETDRGGNFAMIGQPSSCELLLNYPAEGMTLKEGEPITFTWQSDAWATNYAFNLSGFLYDERVHDNTYTFAPGLPAGSYSWYVYVYENGKQIASSGYSNFIVTDTLEITSTIAPASVPILDVSMALIPAGSFLMGGQSCIHWNATSGKAICDKYNPGEDYPPHTVTLDSFSIDIYEVTNAQYAECVAVGQCRPPDVEFRASKNANLPVTQVTWYDAQAYCTWRGARLPTEAEWEKAARGGLEAKWYPWGDDKPVCEPGAAYGAQSHDCWPNEVLAVGSFGSNGYGLYDTSGNVSEWVNDWYQNDYYTVSPGSNPQGPETGAMKVHRGGSYWDDADTWNIDNLGPAYRGTRDPGDAFFETGFRCALGP